jgi:hypothetical protein
VSFPFDLRSAAVFDSHMPGRAHAMPGGTAWDVLINAARHGRGTAWEQHGRGMERDGMCKLAFMLCIISPSEEAAGTAQRHLVAR